MAGAGHKVKAMKKAIFIMAAMILLVISAGKAPDAAEAELTVTVCEHEPIRPVPVTTTAYSMPEIDIPDSILTCEVLSPWIYYGSCRITFYCPGPCCCGQWASGGTASGTTATAGRTVAAGADLPFGTVIQIDGQEYVVEDRGVGSGCIDIFVDSHDEALRRGLYYTDVYIKKK